MHERVSADRATDLLDEARRARALEQVEGDVVVVACDLGEEIEVEVTTDDRADGEQPGRAVGKPGDPSPDHLLDALGDAEGLERERIAGRARLVHVGADLLDEERVSRGLAADAVHELDRRLQCAGRLDQLTDLVLAQARQRELVRQPLVAHVGERGGEGMVLAHLSGAVGPQYQQRRRRRAPREMAHERDGGTVGPVKVVEDEQQRRALGETREHRVHRLEHQIALGVGLRVHGLGEIGELERDVGHESREQGSTAHDLGAHLRWLAVPHHVLDGLDERLIRDDVLLVAAPVQHRRTLLVQAARQLGGEPALADPGLAAQRHDMPTGGLDGAGPPRA